MQRRRRKNQYKKIWGNFQAFYVEKCKMWKTAVQIKAKCEKCKMWKNVKCEKNEICEKI